MQIDLHDEIYRHLQRVTALAKEAEEDYEASLGQRASAMSACSTLLKDITKTQAEVINMRRLQILEKTLIELLPDHLPPKDIEHLLNDYESRLESGMV